MIGPIDPTRPAASSPARRRAGRRALQAVLGAVTLAAVLSGCATGFDAEAVKPYDPADGVNVDLGSIRVSDALVVAPPDGGDGVVVMSVANRGDSTDQLVSVTSEQGQVETSRPAPIRPQQALAIGSDSVPSYTIRDLTAQPGQEVTLELTFARAGVLTIKTVVVPATGYFATITPAPVPTATPTGTASPGATSSPGRTATPAPTGSPGQTPSGANTPTPTASPTG